MREITYKEDDIPAMRERNTVPETWEEWMVYGSLGELADSALIEAGNQRILFYYSNIGREFKLACMKNEDYEYNH